MADCTLPVGLHWIDGESKVVVGRIREGIVDLEPSENGAELRLVEGADDGKDELEVLSQQVWFLRSKRHRVGEERLRLGNELVWTVGEIRRLGPREFKCNVLRTFVNVIRSEQSPREIAIFAITYLRVLTSSITPSDWAS